MFQARECLTPGSASENNFIKKIIKKDWEEGWPKVNKILKSKKAMMRDKINSIRGQEIPKKFTFLGKIKIY